MEDSLRLYGANLKSLKDMLTKDEGFRQFPYKDTVGKLTIGIGRNLDDRGITLDESLYLLDNDIALAESSLIKSFPAYSSLDVSRKAVLISMCFNMGLPKLMMFKAMIDAINHKDYILASKEMLDSKWASQVSGRAYRLAKIMENGIL